jgi:hypothetical protein
MATTIVSSLTRTRGYNPIHYNGSNYYYVSFDSNGAHVWKASTPTGTWTEQDSLGANRPTQAALTTAFAHQTSLLLASGYIVTHFTSATTNFFRIDRFNTNTDTWSTGGQDGQFNSTTGNPFKAQLAQRGDGAVFAVTTGFDTFHGSDVSQIDYLEADSNGTNWDTSFSAIDDGGGNNYGDFAIAPGSASTDLHILYFRNTSTANYPVTQWTELQAKTLSTSTLSTATTTTLNNANGNIRSINNAVFVVPTGGTGRIVAAGADQVNDLIYPRADEDGNLDLGSPVEQGTGTTSPTINIEGESSHISVCVDGDDVIHFVYRSSVDGDLYHITSSDDGDTLDSSTGTELLDGD